MFREQIFDIAIAECESDIQPNRIPDDLGGNWWRANKMVMHHLTRQPDTRYPSRDKASLTLAEPNPADTGLWRHLFARGLIKI